METQNKPTVTDIDRPILVPPGGHKKVLLHSCCAPCSGEVMEAMLASGIDYTIYFYNPNIHPHKEYMLRKEENVRFAEKFGIPFIDKDDDYENDRKEWFAKAKGMEFEPERGIRCTMCFDMRFERRRNTRMNTGSPSLPVRWAFHAGKIWRKSTTAATAPPLLTMMWCIGISTGAKAAAARA